MRIAIDGELSETHAGIWGQISWQRLAIEVLKAAGELHPGEKIVEIELTDKWLRFKVKMEK